MELRHLRYFVAVAEELNVRQAATRLHLSQPPLSRQIHDLEEEVGTKLFVRSQSGMRLTEAGRTFLKEARSILAQSQRAVQLAQAASRGEAGRLRQRENPRKEARIETCVVEREAGAAKSAAKTTRALQQKSFIKQSIQPR
jgi:Bacterial regulatory helix-turn-helix protein, lysR family